jgi:hypothetical protein
MTWRDVWVQNLKVVCLPHLSLAHTHASARTHTHTQISSKHNVCGSVHHGTIHKEKSNKMHQCIKLLLFHIYIKLNMFERLPAHHQEPKTALAAFGFFICLRLLDAWMVDVVRHTEPDNIYHLYVQQPSTYERPEAASAVLGFWWWAVCRPKHVELYINME